MGDLRRFYENIKNALPHKNVRELIEIEKKTGKAIDLGCGAGRDTIFLLRNNWNVLAIDREDTEEIITKKLDKEELLRFRFSRQDFESIKLEKNDLMVANFSLPFCQKDCFNEFWKKITQSISEGRIFCRDFLWKQRFMEKIRRADFIFFKRTNIRTVKRI